MPEEKIPQVDVSFNFHYQNVLTSLMAHCLQRMRAKINQVFRSLTCLSNPRTKRGANLMVPGGANSPAPLDPGKEWRKAEKESTKAFTSASLASVRFALVLFSTAEKKQQKGFIK